MQGIESALSGLLATDTQWDHVIPDAVLYVALGDSTGIGVGAQQGGYVERLFERIYRRRPNSRMVNLCESGAGTAALLERQVPRVRDHLPTVMTLGVGINDVTSLVDPDEFAACYRVIVRELRVHTGAPLVLFNIPCILSAPAMPSSLRLLADAQVQACNEELQRLADAEDLPLVDVYGPTARELPLHPEYFSEDGFHPSDLGYEFTASILWPAVLEALLPPAVDVELD